MIQRINNTKSWFFEKVNMIDKPLAKLTKGPRGSIQINKMRNEKGDKTTEMEEIKKIIRFYYKMLFSTKLENLDKMENFLNRYQVPKLNQDQNNDLKELTNRTSYNCKASVRQKTLSIRLKGHQQIGKGFLPILNMIGD
jgi:hypothetical protein